MAARPPQPQEGIIERFTNEGEGLLGEYGGDLTYTGGIAEGKAEGRGTVRFAGAGRVGWTLRDADFRGGRMLPCRAVFALDAGFACDSGDAFSGPLAAGGGRPADGARGAVVRGWDGGRFQGEWPAGGADWGWFCPRRGAAWDGGRVWSVALDGEESIGSHGYGWPPGTHAGWGPALGVMECPTPQQVRPDPLRPAGPHAPHDPPRRVAPPPLSGRLPLPALLWTDRGFLQPTAVE
jgi:hypothetical protein